MKKSTSRIIMGIDPGLASTGVGVIEELGPRKFRRLMSDHVLTSNHLPLPDRLERIFRLVHETIGRHQPTEVAIESIFFARNVRSAVLMAHGRGAALLAVSQSDIPIHEYSPLEIKQSVVGRGRASKAQVQEMITLLLGLKSPPDSEHQADALACALCHLFRSQGRLSLAKGTGGTSRLTAAPHDDPDPENARKRLLELSFTRRSRRRRRH